MAYVCDRRINRYYDPTTNQFLSIDPRVAMTGQPYVFVNDSPLNATDPLGLYRYTYRWDIGSKGEVGSAKKVMTYLKNNVKKIFPFGITGGTKIRNGETLTLHVAPSLFGGVGNVKVEDVTSTSFTFVVTSHNYFDPAGSSITFSTSMHNGQVYLQQKANAPGGAFYAPYFAQQSWFQQASNLSLALGGSFPIAWP